MLKYPIIKNLLKKWKIFLLGSFKIQFINVYVKIATDVRTEDEHPLSIEDINLIKKLYINKSRILLVLSLLLFYKLFCIYKI